MYIWIWTRQRCKRMRCRLNVRQSKQLTGKHGLREPVDGKPATIFPLHEYLHYSSVESVASAALLPLHSGARQGGRWHLISVWAIIAWAHPTYSRRIGQRFGQEGWRPGDGSRNLNIRPQPETLSSNELGQDITWQRFPTISRTARSASLAQLQL